LKSHSPLSIHYYHLFHTFVSLIKDLCEQNRKYGRSMCLRLSRDVEACGLFTLNCDNDRLIVRSLWKSSFQEQPWKVTAF